MSIVVSYSDCTGWCGKKFSQSLRHHDFAQSYITESCQLQKKRIFSWCIQTI